ncbi:transposase [Flavobacterium sp.]|uniref:transposase n=1 Tax=Flavobacterium sp. TaxID=239 RepID=UPI0012114798|nr:transposase [Flavobacterium sp.]RZJ72030.1 MAG: hypothetical protein EOO49_08365 [Flavobacterium sp.]
MNLEVLQKDKYYHLFNRGINRTDIFANDENKSYFLKLFKKYLSYKCEVFAYCLMNTHFHFAVKIIDESDRVTQALSNFFNAYAKAFNKYTNRSGSLFEKHFKRLELTSEDYLRNLIVYIHRNPTNHLGIEISDFLFASYTEYLRLKSDVVNINGGLALFENLDNFKFVHQQNNEYKEFTD